MKRIDILNQIIRTPRIHQDKLQCGSNSKLKSILFFLLNNDYIKIQDFGYIWTGKELNHVKKRGRDTHTVKQSTKDKLRKINLKIQENRRIKSNKIQIGKL